MALNSNIVADQHCLDRDEIKRAAQGRWADILTRYGVSDSNLKKRHGPCPICGGKDRFRFDNRNGHGDFYCNNCGSGDGFRLLMLTQRCDFVEALRLVHRVLHGSSFPVIEQAAKSAQSSQGDQIDFAAWQEIHRVWNERLPITADNPAGRYLRETRGFRNLAKFPESLGYNPQTPYGRSSRPALLAAFHAPNGELRQVLRIFLTLDGRKAGDLPNPKVLMRGPFAGAMRGGAIRLFEPTDVLGIAEGIESAIAAHLLTGIPTWATQSSVLMPQVVLPRSVKQVVIFADNDPLEKGCAGQTAALELRKRLLDQGRKVEIYTPTACNDFSDLLNGVVA